ncbi:MAG: glycosyltransferase family 2 protein [Frankiales bacterium]|nr:glycosyltransferase family 2 protein [Frankiales bacterium]
MSTRASTLVIVPAFQEEGSVGLVVHALRRVVPEADVLVVDDGSLDDTGGVAERAGARVLTLPYNLGVGGAMRAGFKYALRYGYDAAVQVDADGQHDPEDVRRLLAGLRDSDVVIGARFAGVGSYHVKGPRRWAMVFLARALSRATGVTLTDATSGFRACNRRAMTLFARYYPVEYLGDTVEALLIVARTNLTVSQVPVDMKERTSGRPSAAPFQAAVYLGRAVLALALGLIRKWPSEGIGPLPTEQVVSR